MRGGLLCVALDGFGRLCTCESHPSIPSALPFMNKHGEAACEHHGETAKKYGVTPFPCTPPPAETDGGQS
jgi:hypothetical protein